MLGKRATAVPKAVQHLLKSQPAHGSCCNGKKWDQPLYQLSAHLPVVEGVHKAVVLLVYRVEVVQQTRERLGLKGREDSCAVEPQASSKVSGQLARLSSKRGLASWCARSQSTPLPAPSQQLATPPPAAAHL